MRYSKNFERDFLFYKRNINNFTFFGNYPPEVFFDHNGVDAKKAFYIHDSTGKSVKTSEPELLQSLLVCKKSVNFHIKMWAEGFAEWTLLEPDLNDIISDYKCPQWVTEAIKKQGLRIRYKKNHKYV